MPPRQPCRPSDLRRASSPTWRASSRLAIIDAPDRERRPSRARCTLWEDAPGLPGFFTTVDHKRIGMRYIYTSFVFFFIAGAHGAGHASAARAAERPRARTRSTYNELFTMHGTTMIFLFNTPGARRVRQLPASRCMIGTRDMAFPRLERVQLLGLPARRALHVRQLRRRAPCPTAAGSPTRRSRRRRSPRAQHRLLGPRRRVRRASPPRSARSTSSSPSSRCARPGMTLNRMPIFVWSMLVFSFMVIFAVPAVTLAAGAARARPALRHAVLRARRSAAACCCTSTCSGSGAIPRCTSCSSRPPAWSRRSSRCSRGGRSPATSWVVAALVADRVHQLRRVGAPHVRHRACRRWRMAFFSGGQPAHRHPERHPVLRVDRHDVARQGAASPRRCCSPSGSCSSSCSAGSPA